MLTLRRQIGLESLFLIAAVAASSIFFVIKHNNYESQFYVSLNTPIVPVVADASLSKTSFSSQISPDGMKKVVMKVTQNSDNTSTYDFSTADVTGANEQHILTKTLNAGESISIPFNTWSPDDKYFFIQQDNGGSKAVFVFQSTGAQFADGLVGLDATDLFVKANTGNSFDEATGWASESLIIINTKKQDGAKGSSYWFEIPSKAIIQLSTEF
jgi:hypothetical protein